MKTSFTISEFAKHAGLDRHTLGVKVTKHGVKPTGKVTTGKAAGADLFHIRDLVRAATGDEQAAARLGKTRAQAEKIELANARDRAELVELAAVEQFAKSVHRALSVKIAAMPVTDTEKDVLLVEIQPLLSQDWKAGTKA